MTSADPVAAVARGVEKAGAARVQEAQATQAEVPGEKTGAAAEKQLRVRRNASKSTLVMASVVPSLILHDGIFGTFSSPLVGN